MLTDDFELRIGSAPGIPVPRADWVRAAIAKPDPPSQPAQIAVHEFGEIAIASFLQARPQAAQKKADGDTFIVDVWKRSGESWKLATRYAAPAGGPDFAILGAGAPQPVIPKRY
jgi:hypothetical protein